VPASALLDKPAVAPGEDRCAVIDHGDGTITLELDPAQSEDECWMSRRVELQREH